MKNWKLKGVMAVLGAASLLGSAAESSPEGKTTGAAPTMAPAVRRPLAVGTRPESVTRGFGGHLYVTVMNAQEPGDGVVKVVKGDTVEVFATGLDEPKGIAFTGEYLVTTDLKRVWRIDARGRAVVLADERDFPLPVSFLNDTAAAADGKSVFVTDMGARDKMNGPDGLWPLDSPQAAVLPAIGRVYQITLEGKVTVAVEANADMPCPNGVAVDPLGGLLVAEFFKGNILSVRNGNVRVLNTGFRGADGIQRGADGRIYVSSWTQGKVWRLGRMGDHAEMVAEGFESAADFHVDESAGVLILPDMKAGTLNWRSVR
jgi:sugar lactone lactonase YvrE